MYVIYECVMFVCMCCMCVIMEMCPYLQRATGRSGLPPSVSRCHMCVSFYFCFASLCFGSNCSVYSRRTGLGISESFCLPSHCRRTGIAEACYHIGSGDETLVLRLCTHISLPSEHLPAYNQVDSAGEKQRSHALTPDARTSFSDLQIHPSVETVFVIQN